MQLLAWTTLVAITLYLLKSQQERRRIALLAGYLGQFQIEKLLETLMEGYLRALGETHAQRQLQVWNHMHDTETRLSEQVASLATELARADAQDTRVSTLGLALPFADKLFPASTFDLRKAIAIHAHGIRDAVQADPDLEPKNRAFTISAELFLMQHTCHWFCKSKAVASARMVVRHKTGYEQLVASVAPQTAKAYRALLAG